ncbi:MAG: alpha/beta hydrolase [Desulfobacterales bacterium]|nr:alpha/beta hydrolase [Desulfobacterales bacterium]
MMKMTHSFLRVATALIAFFIGGCVGNGHKPLETLTYTAEPVRNKHLIIFLRGLGGTWRCLWKPHKCFETEGFVEAVQKRKIPFDMIAPNTHFGYYKDRTLEKRLTEDVIRPAKANGYEKIWLAGVSMGGLGAILYLIKHPENIDGVLLLGPYLGDASIAAEISKAGGLKPWDPGPYDGETDWQRLIWDWLKQNGANPAGQAPVYLGIGNHDRYYDAQKLLAESLPEDRVIIIAGGHRPSTFKRIWDIFLDKHRLSP